MTNVIGMQGNRLLLRPVFDRYFPVDYVTHLFDGRDWSESQIVMAVYQLEKVKRHSKKLRLPEAIAFLKSLLT